MEPRLYLALKLNTTEILTTSPRPIRRKINQATPERRFAYLYRGGISPAIINCWNVLTLLIYDQSL
jgi:hypothetical protein